MIEMTEHYFPLAWLNPHISSYSVPASRGLFDEKFRSAEFDEPRPAPFYTFRNSEKYGIRNIFEPVHYIITLIND